MRHDPKRVVSTPKTVPLRIEESFVSYTLAGGASTIRRR